MYVKSRNGLPNFYTLHIRFCTSPSRYNGCLGGVNDCYRFPKPRTPLLNGAHRLLFSEWRTCLKFKGPFAKYGPWPHHHCKQHGHDVFDNATSWHQHNRPASPIVPLRCEQFFTNPQACCGKTSAALESTQLADLVPPIVTSDPLLIRLHYQTRHQIGTRTGMAVAVSVPTNQNS